MTDRASRADCPADQTLAAFIDGELNAPARREISEHLTHCANCYDVWLTAHEVRSSMRTEQRAFRRWPVAAGAALGAAIIVGLLFLMTPLGERFAIRPRADLEALAAAAPPRRIVEGRLSGFPHRPLKEATRGNADPASDPDNWKLYSVASRVASQAKESPTPQNLHAFGVSYLLLGQWNDAVLTLEEALRKDTGEQPIPLAMQKSGNAGLLNDLSAAYYARGKKLDRFQDLIAAGEAAERAFARSQSPAVAFNRALAVEAAHGSDEARKAWDEYMRLEGEGGWREEAGRRRRAIPRSPSRGSSADLKKCYEQGCASLAETIDGRYLQATTFALEIVLPEWAEASRAGDARKAERALRFAESIGDVIVRDSGDALLADAAATIRRGRNMDALRTAHAAYATGRRLYANQGIRLALKHFEEARDAARSAGSPLEIPAANYATATLLYSSDAVVAGREVRFLIDRFDTKETRYFAAVGQLHWLDGVICLKRGLPQEALATYRAALHRFTQAKQNDNVAAAHALIAEAADVAGDPETAWRERDQGLRALRASGQLDRLYIILGEAADAAENEGWLHASERYRRQLVVTAREIGDPARLGSAFSGHARTRLALGKVTAAAADLSMARQLIDAIPDAVHQMRMKGWVSLTEAKLAARTNPSLEEPLLTAALDALKSANDRGFLAEAYLRRAHARLRTNRIHDAERDLHSGIAEMEKTREGFGDPVARGRYFARTQELFDLAIMCAWRQRKYGEAFNLAERSRARVLLDGASIQPTTIQAAMRRIDPDVRLVEYAVVPGSLLIWVVSNGRYRAVGIPLPEGFPARHVNRMRRAQTDAQHLEASKALYDLLIAPVASELNGARRIVFVPNKELADVSFASLHDRRSRKYLIERAEVMVAPSAAFYDFAAQRDQKTGWRGQNALIVGSSTEEKLGALPTVAGETARVAALYRQPETFIDTPIAKHDFLRRASNASVVHFAGHGVANAAYPEYAALLIARDAPLYAHEIASARFDKTRLVVLSSCGSRPGSPANEAVVSVPYAFLAAGVPSVLAASDEVTDEAAAELLVRFHEALTVSAQPASALRSAQLQMLKEGVSPRRWGSWQLFGGLSI